jgi:phage shock protein B
MEGGFIIAITVGILFIGLPWLVLHYITRWKQSSSLTLEDENLLDDLHDIARRLDDRLTNVERIMAADRDARVVTDIRPQIRKEN